MNEMPMLMLDRVSGGYHMNKPVLHQITFSINPSEMVALIGLNGAGKSTTMKHILGLLEPHEGTIRIREHTLREATDVYRASYAYVPETPLLYEELTVEEHLELVGRAYGIEEKLGRSRANELLERFQMTDARGMLSAHLSKGMKQKVMIMAAFLADSPLYIIDEPFLGLDPLGIRAVLELLQEKRKNGAAILISSHILSMIESYCDRFIVLHRGKIIANGSVQDICKKKGMPIQPLEELFYALIQREDAR